MNNHIKPVAIVLGGTVPHCELIRQLQKRGYYVILIDYLCDPPARTVADEHIRESTLEKEKVFEIAKRENAQLVVSGCVEHANVTACYVMEHLSKKAPYSYETSLKVTNKGLMKKIMMDSGIPTSKYIYVDSLDSFRQLGKGLRFPLMVKPADGNSSNGVKKAASYDEAVRYLQDALKISRSKQAILEEFVSGQEISAYCFIKDKKAKLLMTAERISAVDGSDKVIKCYASIAPARISDMATREAERIAGKIAEVFELDNTALFFQGIVNKNRIDVIEFGARIGGGVCFKTIYENTGFDVISAIIDAWEGREINFSEYHKPDSLLVVNTIYGENSVFDHIEGGEDIVKNSDAIAFYQMRSHGDVIDNSTASKSRIAFCIVRADNEKELLQKVHNIYETIKVVDKNGKNVIRKDINLENLWNRQESIEGEYKKDETSSV